MCDARHRPDLAARRARPWSHGESGRSQVLRVGGLRAPVEIVRDPWGVPHIHAHNRHDLYFAQGYTHAADRLFQMEFSRRLAAGRLSELAGPRMLEADRWLRTLTLRRVAEREARRARGRARSVLAAYAAGVNASIKACGTPVELRLLRVRPEPWTPADSLSWSKMMSWFLSVNWEAELLRGLLAASLGRDVAGQLEPPYDDRWPTIVPREGGWWCSGERALRRADDASPVTGPTAMNGVGSNSWAVHGARTTTGAPLLANDMHLPLRLPCIWYENHLVGGGLDVTGVSFPGVPAVICGHNGRVAWGYTNGMADVQDVYVERLRRTRGGGIQAEYRGEWYDATVWMERIRVRGRADAEHEVVMTRHGPLIDALVDWPAGVGSPIEALAGGGQAIALRWTSLEPDRTLDAVLRMQEAPDCHTCHESLRLWGAPVVNVTYADVEGNIGYTLAGHVPIRARGDGAVPVPGWSGEHEWLGYIPFDELPHRLNPPEGHIVTANNRIVDDSYPYAFGKDTSIAHRAQRITELLLARERVDLPYVRRMQSDQCSPVGRCVGPYVAGLVVVDAELARLVESFRGWDGSLAAESRTAAVYEVLLESLLRLLGGAYLGRQGADPDLVERYLGRGPNPFLTPESLFGARALEWLLSILPDPQHPAYDLGNGESRDDVLCLALREAKARLCADLGRDPAKWTWGRLHRLVFQHPFGEIKGLGRILNRGPYPVGGDAMTVWATGGGAHATGAATLVGPPYRMIVDLGDVRRSQSVLVPGQSGVPWHAHYDDQIDDWFAGRYHPMLYAGADVEAHAVRRQRLLPA